MVIRPTVFSVRPSTSPVFGCLSSSPSRNTTRSTPATTPSRCPTERVAWPPSTLSTSPSTLGKSATTCPTRVVMGVGAAPAVGGDWAHAGATAASRRRTAAVRRDMAPMIPIPEDQGKQCGQKTAGPGITPRARILHNRSLEAEADASRGDGNRLDTNVLAGRRGSRTVIGAEEPMGQGIVGHHVASRPVEHQARSETIRQGEGEFRTEELALTLGPAGLAPLAADEGGLETTVRDYKSVGVHLVRRPAWRDTGAHRQGRRPRVAGLETGHDAAVLVPADLRAGVARRARGAHDLVVVNTQGDDLGAPVRQVACVRIERLEILDALVGVALGVLPRGPHDEVGQE